MFHSKSFDSVWEPASSAKVVASTLPPKQEVTERMLRPGGMDEARAMEVEELILSNVSQLYR